jgi:hypothetical protein
MQGACRPRRVHLSTCTHLMTDHIVPNTTRALGFWLMRMAPLCERTLL